MLRLFEAAIGCPVSTRACLAVPLHVEGQVIGLPGAAASDGGATTLRPTSSACSRWPPGHHRASEHSAARARPQAAVLEERARLARELHDAVTQTLFSASLIAEALPSFWQNAPPLAKIGAEQLRRLTRTALAEMRSLLLELRPAALTERPLGELLASLCTATRGRAGIPIELEVRGVCKLPPEVQIALYRLAQEALNNVVKHADASTVKVRLACSRDRR